MEPGELHRIDSERILRYDLTLPLLLSVRFIGQPIRIWSAGKAYRLGRVDAQHLEAFHQAEVLTLDARDRLDAWQMTGQVLRSVYLVVPGRSVKIVPTRYAMCSQSWELEVEDDGRWIEVMGWGIYTDEIVRHLGADPATHTAIGVGYGLERLAMLRHGIDDIPQNGRDARRIGSRHMVQHMCWACARRGLYSCWPGGLMIRPLRNFVRILALLVACTAVTLAQGAGPQGPAPAGARGGRGAAGQTVEKIRLLKPDLYLITGGGANTLVRVTPDGLVVVDTKNPGDDNFNRVMEEIRSVSQAPVKYVINTHHHPDHVGNNQKFIDAGATVLASTALKSFMASDPRTRAIPGLPTQTFDRDYTLKFGGAEVRLSSFGRGHTGDDTMVYFPDARVVMVSDQITDGTPIVDFANGGSAVEWTRILDGVLALDFEVAIPGRGEPKSRAEVQAFRMKFATLVSRASDAVKAGATREQLSTQVKTDDLGWQLNPQFFGSLYDELMKK